MRRSFGDPQLSFRMFFTMFLLAALYLAFVLVLFQAGLDSASMLVIVGLMLAAQYYFSDQMVLWSAGARIVSPEEAPELHGMVDRLVAMADIPKPRVAIMHTAVPNAFATGRDPNHAVVAVTTGLLDRLDPPEIEAVLAHELTHIKNRDVFVMTLASFFATVAAFILRYAFWFGGMGGGRRDERGGGSAVAVVYLASLLVWVLSFFLIRALSRYREYAADRGAAILTGAPSQLASALTKISGTMSRIPQRDLRQAEALNAFYIIPALSGQSFMELLSTHPSLENRLAYLRRLEEEFSG